MAAILDLVNFHRFKELEKMQFFFSHHYYVPKKNQQKITLTHILHENHKRIY